MVPSTSSASIPFALQDGDVEGAHDFLDARDLHVQLVGHLVARALVVGVEVVAEGRAQVEADGQVVRRLVGQNEVEQGAGEAVGGVGRLAALGRERLQRQGEEHAVGQGVAVDHHEAVGGHRSSCGRVSAGLPGTIL
jgi:hypothetical protein